MNHNKQLVKNVEDPYLENFKKDPTGYTLDVVSGIIKNTQSGYDLIKTGSLVGLHFIKGFIHEEGVVSLFRTLEEHRLKGKIINYLDDPWGKSTIADLFSEIENKKILTLEKLEIIKSLLLITLAISTEDDRKMRARELIKVVTKLETLDVRILKSLFEKKDTTQVGNVQIEKHDWEKSLITTVDSKLEGLILESVKKLREFHLIDQFHGISGVPMPSTYRDEQVSRNGLSEMGVAFIEYIKEYGGSEAS